MSELDGLGPDPDFTDCEEELEEDEEYYDDCPFCEGDGCNECDGTGWFE